MNEPISDVRLTMVRQIVSGPFSISAGDVRAILARLDDAERKADLHDQVMHDYRDAMIRANAAERERDALRQDAERYRWLRGQFRTFSPDMSGQHSYCLASGIMRAKGPNIDAAIDAALAAFEEMP